MADDKLLKVSEVAKRLNLSPHTVRNYVNSGRIKSVKIGSTIRIPESVVNGIINTDIK